jgi:hypothetical protein
MKITHVRINWTLLLVSIWLSLIICFRHDPYEVSTDSTKLETPSIEVMLPSNTNISSAPRCHEYFCGHGLPGEVAAADDSRSFENLRLIGIPWTERQFTADVPCFHLDTFARREKLSKIAHYDAENFETTVLLSSDGCDGRLVFLFREVMGSAISRLRLRLRDDVDRSRIEKLLLERLCVPSESFRIRIVGPQIDSYLSPKCLVAGSESTNRFEYNFSLALPGVYHIEGEWMYSDFSSLDEKLKTTIPMIRKNILPVTEEKGKFGELSDALHHDPRLNLYHQHHPEEGRSIRKSKFRSSKLFVWDQYTPRSNVSFSCSRTSPRAADLVLNRCFTVSEFQSRKMSGRWVTEKFVAEEANWGLRHPLAHTHIERSNPSAIYFYRPLATWCPQGLRSMNPAKFNAWIRSRFNRNNVVIAFVGDSHLRVSFVHLKNFFAAPCQLEDHRVKALSGRHCRFSAGGDNTTSLIYVNDVLLQEFSRHSAVWATADVIVLGMGSWALGGAGSDPTNAARAPENYGRWSAAEYARHIRMVGSSIQSFLREKSTRLVVWMTIPAYPHNGRRFARLKGEHRTNPKIDVFNRIAGDALASAVDGEESDRLILVDQFDVTYPVMHLSLDHNHHTTYAQDAILHLLLNAIAERL